MSFKIETPNENPFTSAVETAKSLFWTGLVCGVFIALGLYAVVNWEGWKSTPPRSAAQPPTGSIGELSSRPPTPIPGPGAPIDVPIPPTMAGQTSGTSPHVPVPISRPDRR